MKRYFKFLTTYHIKNDPKTSTTVNPGDYSEEAIPDPFPNSEVKLFTPMVLPKGERVGHCQVPIQKKPTTFKM